MSLYPNPSDGQFNLDFNSQHSEELQLGIYDLTGRFISGTVVNAQAGENKISIDLTNNAKGVYIIRLKSETGSSISRITVR